MIAGCANAILRRDHSDSESPPRVSEHWARRFLENTQTFELITVLFAYRQTGTIPLY